MIFLPPVPTLGQYLQQPTTNILPMYQTIISPRKATQLLQRRYTNYTNLSALDGEHVTCVRLHIAEHVLRALPWV